MRYWAHLERFVGGIIRVFDTEDQFGEPYLYCMTFKDIEGRPLSEPLHIIEFMGATKAPTPEQLRAIIKMLAQEGITVRRLRVGGARPGVKKYTPIDGRVESQHLNGQRTE